MGGTPLGPTGMTVTTSASPVYQRTLLPRKICDPNKRLVALKGQRLVPILPPKDYKTNH